MVREEVGKYGGNVGKSAGARVAIGVLGTAGLGINQFVARSAHLKCTPYYA